MFKVRNREKLINAIIFFAHNTNYLGKTKLFKLLYMLDFEHFRQTGRSVTGLDYYAWKHGPVPTSLDKEWNKPAPDLANAITINSIPIISYFRDHVTANVDFDDKHFSKRELRIMNELADTFRNSKSRKMIDFTHARDGAWMKVRNEQGSNHKIPYELAISEHASNREDILESAKEFEAIDRTAQSRQAN